MFFSQAGLFSVIGGCLERVPCCHHLFCYVFQSGWLVFCCGGMFGKGSMLPPFVLLCFSVRLVSVSDVGGCLERVPCCHHLSVMFASQAG